MVGLPEVVLYVIVLCWDSKFEKLVLESSALLEKTMNFTFYFHNQKIKLNK